MLVYIVCLFMVSVVAIFSERFSYAKYDAITKEKHRYPSKLLVVFILLILSFLYTFRWKVGTDFMGYYRGFAFYGHSDIKDILGTRDWAYSLLAWLSYQIRPGNYFFFAFILSTITYIPILYIYAKFSDKFSITMYLYLTTLLCFWPYNGVRQSIACSISFIGLDFLYQKKYVQYAVLVLIASLFHATALILVPLLFFVIQKPWSKITNIVSVVIMLSIVFLRNVWEYIISFLSVMGQDKIVHDYQNVNIGTGSINVLRIIIALLPVFISYYIKTVDEKMDEDRLFCILSNTVLLGSLFMVAAYRVTVLARLASYFTIATPLFYAEVIQRMTSRTKTVFSFILCACYFAYMIIMLPVDSNLVPYRFSF